MRGGVSDAGRGRSWVGVMGSGVGGRCDVFEASGWEE